MKHLQELIKTTMREKDLTRSQVIKRMGIYKNLSKGCRHLDELIRDTSEPKIILDNLHTGLDIDRSLTTEAMKRDKLDAIRKAEEDYKELIPFLFVAKESDPSMKSISAMWFHMAGYARYMLIKLPDYLNQKNKQGEVRWRRQKWS